MQMLRSKLNASKYCHRISLVSDLHPDISVPDETVWGWTAFEYAEKTLQFLREHPEFVMNAFLKPITSPAGGRLGHFERVLLTPFPGGGKPIRFTGV